MKASYVSGAVKGLAELGITDFDFILTGSAGAPSAAYYITKQFDLIEKCWDVLATKEFVDPLRFWNIVNLNYLVGQVLKGKEYELDTEKLYSSSIEFQIATLNANTGGLSYFSNHDDVDVIDVIRATLSIPVLARSVYIQGVPYNDSFEGSYPWFQIQRARQLGAERFVVINCLHDLPKKVFDFESLILGKNKAFKRKHARYHKIMMDHIHLKGREEFFYLSPSKPTLCGDFTSDLRRLKHSFELGRQDMLASGVVEFLKKEFSV